MPVGIDIFFSALATKEYYPWYIILLIWHVSYSLQISCPPYTGIRHLCLVPLPEKRYTKVGSCSIRVITKLPNSEQSYKGKVKTHNYINTTKSVNNRKTENRNDPDLVQAFLKKWWVESDFKAPNLPFSLRFKGSGCHYNSIYNNTQWC